MIVFYYCMGVLCVEYLRFKVLVIRHALFYIFFCLVFAACNGGSEPEPDPQGKNITACYEFETWYKDTLQINKFKLYIKTTKDSIHMYSDSAMLHLEYSGKFLIHDSMKLDYTPYPITAYGILNDSVCEIRYWDFLHKGRKQ